MQTFYFILAVTVGTCSSFLIQENFPLLNVKFYPGPSTSNHTQLRLHELSHLSRHKSFSRHRPTVFFVSGWMSSPDAEASQQLVRAYLKRGDYNVLMLDWSDYSVGTYYSVMIRISKISRIVGQSLKKLFDKGLDVNSFHCVGHSFGAHSCGIMGRELLQVSHQKYKLGRITGLDPAGPGFYPVLFEQPLNPKDAVFVDSIHSDVFFIGTRHATGHVTFFPNYDTVQPGCPPMNFNSFHDFLNSMCSHFNALRYFVDTLNPKFGKLFPSQLCHNSKDFTEGRCSSGAKNFMGLQADPKLPGKFFIKLSTKHVFDGENFHKYILSRIGQRVDALVSMLLGPNLI